MAKNEQAAGGATPVPTEEEYKALLAENKRLNDRITELEGQRKTEKQTAGGFVVTTPKNPNYEGKTAGVFFRKGQAFIPDGEDAAKTALMLEQEFQYKVLHIDDFRQVPGLAGIDVVGNIR